MKVCVDEGLPFPPDEASYYTPSELNEPGIDLGVESLQGWQVKLLPHHEANPLTVILGASGSGKTTCQRRIAYEIPRADPTATVFVIDRLNNFSGLQEVHGQDWLVLDGPEGRYALLDRRLIRAVIQLLGENRSLEKSLNNVSEVYDRITPALDAMGQSASAPNIDHIINGLRSLRFPDTKPDYLLSALTELADLRRAMPVWNYSASDMMDRLLAPGKLTVIRTSAWNLAEERLFVGWALTYAIHTGLTTARSHFVYLLFDEIQHLFNREAWDSKALRSQKNAVLHSRQHKVVIVGNAQMPAFLEPELLASAGTIICKSLLDNRNIQEACGALRLPFNSGAQLLSSLDPSEAICRVAGRPGPFKVIMPLAPVLDKCDEVKRRKKVLDFLATCRTDPGPSWEALHRVILKTSVSNVATPTESDLRLLRASALTFKEPLFLRDLAASAGISVPEASAAARRLVQLGLAERQEATIERHRSVFLEPTIKGWQALSLCQPTGAGRGNAPTRYCLTRAERPLAARAYRTYREAERRGKRIDLVGEKSGAVIFVEVEMTPQNAARNAVADLAVAGPEVKQIAVVCPTEAVLKQVRKAVESAVDAQSLKRFVFKVVSDL